jgi:hypothetical protein
VSAAAKINWTTATIAAVKTQAALEKAVLAIPEVKSAKAGAPVLVFVSAGCDRCSQVEKTLAACGKFTFVKVDASGLDAKSSPAANKDNAPIAILVADGKVAKVVTGPNPQAFANLTKEMQKLNK